MSGTSFLVPLAGIVTAPMVARALSPVGRGELAAALAPSGLIIALASGGLPDALVYYLAKFPRLTRPAMLKASLVTLALGAVSFALVLVFLPLLAAGNAELARFTVLATILTLPTLVVGVFRAAAFGRQMWVHTAAERVIITVLRLIGLGVFFLTGGLTVYVALMIGMIGPILAGIVYLPLLRRPPQNSLDLGREAEKPADMASPVSVTAELDQADLLVSDQRAPSTQSGGPGVEDGPFQRLEAESRPADATEPKGFLDFVKFGAKVWLGSVASMVLARAGALLMVPLSTERALGLLSVAVTISDVPLLVAFAVQGALFGVNSLDADAGQVATTSRLTLLLGVVGCVGLGVTLPFWIRPVFGSAFVDALVPTWLLMFAALLLIPGLMASSGVAAWGRPGLRSMGLLLALVVYLLTFVTAVPSFGVLGACLAGILSNLAMTVFMVHVSARLMKLRPRMFFLITRADLARCLGEGRRMVRWTHRVVWMILRIQ